MPSSPTYTAVIYSVPNEKTLFTAALVRVHAYNKPRYSVVCFKTRSRFVIDRRQQTDRRHYPRLPLLNHAGIRHAHKLHKYTHALSLMYRNRRRCCDVARLL